MTTPSGPHRAHKGRHGLWKALGRIGQGGRVLPSLLQLEELDSPFWVPPPLLQPIYMCGGLPLEAHQIKGPLSRIAPHSPGLIGLSV